MLELAVLGSGSSGNSALICRDDVRILIDAGLSARQLCLRLEQLGVDPDTLTAVVLTHEHGDHTRGLDVFCRKRELPVYATPHTCALVRESVKSTVHWHQFEAGRQFDLAGIQVETFSVPHDAVDPVGFVFRCPESSVGVLSDVGHVTRMIVDRLKGVDTLFAESNYDDVLLQNDTIRPWSTKQRISNRHGHLSNEQTAELVAQIAHPNLKRVVLGHLSGDCNEPNLAKNVVAQKLSEVGFDSVVVECADRQSPLPLEPAARQSTPPATEENDANLSRLCEPSDSVSARSSAPVEWKQSEWVF